MRASWRLGWLRPSALHGARPQLKTQTIWQAIVKASSAALRRQRHIYIPSTREALTCWGYMQAIQDLSVLADENGHRIMGACPPEQRRRCSSFGRSSAMRAHIAANFRPML